MKYLLYDIQYNEQFFKQLSGFLYFINEAVSFKCTLVIPHFRTLPKDERNMTIKGNNNFGYHPWEKFYDLDFLKSKYNIITIDEFKNLDLEIDVLFSKTNRFCSENSIKISDIEIKFKNKISTGNNFRDIYLKNDIVAICGTTSQFPYSMSGYHNIRKNIRYHSYLYNLVEKYLEENNIKKYIAIHWRQTDFLLVRSSRNDVLNTPEQLVEKCKKLMQENDVDKIYLATDSKDFKKLKYINDNLPLFFFNPDDLDIKNDKYIFAVIESIICAKSVKFYGTKTSLYSINICGERGALGLDPKQYYI